jgi:hypothetical protein
METKSILWTNIVVFSIVGIVHLCNAIFSWNFMVADWLIPRWLSGVAFVLLSALGWYNWKATQ